MVGVRGEEILQALAFFYLLEPQEINRSGSQKARRENEQPKETFRRSYLLP